jgi:hypothetical protein
MRQKERQQDVIYTYLPMILRSVNIISPATGAQKILSDFKVYEKMPELENSNINKQSGFKVNNR